MKIVVYTSLYGNCKEVVKDPVSINVRKGDSIKYVCFSDRDLGLSIYESSDYFWRDADPRRTSRWAKINSHLVFPDADITVWHDAAYQVVNIYDLLDTLEKDWEFCTFPHYRNSIEEEIRACIVFKKESQEILENQYFQYKFEGMQPTERLYDCSCIVRKNTPNIKSINDLWWSEYCAYSCRDQISLPYVFWKLKYQNWKAVLGDRKDNLFFNQTKYQ